MRFDERVKDMAEQMGKYLDHLHRKTGTYKGSDGTTHYKATERILDKVENSDLLKSMSDVLDNF